VSDGSRRLWFVRHGETEGQSSIRWHGSGDVRLSDEGRAQIRALAPWLRDVPFTAVVHSPLVRAAESASILAEQCGLPASLLRCDERWREICFGQCEGMTRDEIAAAFPEFWAEHEAGRTDGFPGGEPRSAFISRIAAVARELAAEPWQGDLLVVSHRGTTRHALRTLLAVPAGEADPFGVELGSLSVLREDLSVLREDGRGVLREDGRWQLDLLGALP
jgi:broad specificity phosphatase PhoE